MENNQFLLPMDVSIEQLPEVINIAFSQIKKFDENIKSSSESAKFLANSAKQKKAGWSLFGGDKKEAIEALQLAVKCQSDVLDDSIEAIKNLFENQEKFAKCISYLYGLGVTSIAANRTVLRELELKLRDASEKELSELARQEIEVVILQLRAQENIQNKIDRNERILREHRNELNMLNEKTASALRLKEDIAQLQSNNERVLREHRNELNMLNEKTVSTLGLKEEIAQLQRNNDELKKRVQELSKKSFFDSVWYKAAVGVAALVALGISIFSVL